MILQRRRRRRKKKRKRVKKTKTGKNQSVRMNRLSGIRKKSKKMENLISGRSYQID